MRVPLWAIVEGKCACGEEGCPAVGKHPRPYTTEEVPGAGYGIYTGGGLVVLDVDCKPGKPNGYDSLSAAGVELPDTYTVKTPTGGAHLYYTYPQDISLGNRQGVFPGVDIRAEGGFVVGQGSPHVNGGTYQYLGGEMVPAPQWLMDAARKDVLETVDTPEPLSPEDPLFEDHVRRCTEDLRTFPPAVEGDCGGTQLFKACQIPVRTYRLPLDVAESLILEIYNPRCQPPWSGSQLTQIGYKVRQAAEKGRAPVGTHDWLAKLKASTSSSTAYTFSPGDMKSIPWTLALSDNDLVRLLHDSPQWKDVWRYDAFRRRFLAVNPPMPLEVQTDGGITDGDVTAVRCWFQCHGLVVRRKNEELDATYTADWPTVWGKAVDDDKDQMVKGIKVSKESMYSCLDVACRKNTFHPIKEYLESTRGKSQGLLFQVADKALGNPDPSAAVFVARTLIGAVRRILQPGCRMETVLTLWGEQGAQKTTFVRQLFGAEFTRSQMPDLQSKDASAALNGFWAIELAELDRVLRAETSTLKEFFSRTHDDYRPPYGRHEVHVARQSVFIGTTNVKDFLRDPTGARRYWPVSVGNIDIGWVDSNRDAIWSEALERCEAGDQHHLTPEEYDMLLHSQEEFNDEDPWLDVVRQYCAGRKFVRSPEEIYVSRLKGEMLYYSKKEKGRIRDCLLRLGCIYQAVRDGKEVFRAWKIPCALGLEQAAPEEEALRQIARLQAPMN